MVSSTLRRSDLIKMLGGTVLLAGCGSGATALSSIRRAETSNYVPLRMTVARSRFPLARPDSSVAAITDPGSNVHPECTVEQGVQRRTATLKPSCSASGGGYYVLRANGYTAYTYDTQNYQEVYATGGALDSQIYYTAASGGVLSMTQVFSNGVSVQSQTPTLSTFKVGPAYTLSNGVSFTLPSATTFTITQSGYTGSITGSLNQSAESITLGGSDLTEITVAAYSADCYMAELGVISGTAILMLAARAAAVAACARVPPECGFAQAVIYGSAMGIISLWQQAVSEYCNEEQVSDDGWGGGPDDPGVDDGGDQDNASEGYDWLYYD